MHDSCCVFNNLLLPAGKAGSRVPRASNSFVISSGVPVSWSWHGFRNLRVPGPEGNSRQDLVSIGPGPRTLSRRARDNPLWLCLKLLVYEYCCARNVDRAGKTLISDMGLAPQGLRELTHISVLDLWSKTKREFPMAAFNLQFFSVLQAFS